MGDTGYLCVLCLKPVDSADAAEMRYDFARAMRPRPKEPKDLKRWKEELDDGAARWLGGGTAYVHLACVEGFNHRWSQSIGCQCEIGHAGCCLS